VVVAVWFTTTCWPVGVESVNPDADIALTVPVDPPSAGPDRELAAPPSNPAPATALEVAGCPAVAVESVAAQPDSPTTATVTAARIHLPRGLMTTLLSAW
jgi:hypothetical protein